MLFHYENSSGEISIKDILNLQLKKSKQTKLGPLLQKYVMEIEITRTRRVMKKTQPKDNITSLALIPLLFAWPQIVTDMF